MNAEISSNYAPELEILELTISSDAMEHLYEVMGVSSAPVSDEKLARAIAWQRCTAKLAVDRVLSTTARLMGVGVLVRALEKDVERLDGESGEYVQKGGFFMGDEVHPVKVTKVRTMVPNAASLIDSPLEHKSFCAEGKIDCDDRLLGLWWVAAARRIGIDELPQVTKNMRWGGATLVGARMYSWDELSGTEMIWNLRNGGGRELPEETKSMMERYAHVVRQLKPRSGIFGPAATSPESISHITRMAYDLAYWERANPFVDMCLFKYGLLHRVVRGRGGG